MDKEAYKAYCQKDSELPLFLHYDWVTAVAPPENWGVVFSGEPQDPKGFLVYFIKKKFGFRKITLPPLTPFMGPWVIYPEGQKRSQRYGHDKKVMDELIEQLPSHDDLILQFHPSVTNWLPFFWKGFREETKYTYRLQDTSDTQMLFDGMRGNIRRAVRKAAKKLEVSSSDSVEEIHDLKLKDYAAKGISLNYDRAYFRAIDRALAPKGARRILYATDGEGNVHGGIYLVMDGRTCYYLVGAIDPESKSDGAMSLLMWEGIQEASRQGLAFDFEGSMIEPIERYFRSFGAEQVPYHSIASTPSYLLRSAKALNFSFKGKAGP